MVVRLYTACAPLFEHPRRTGSISFEAQKLLVHDRNGRPTFEVENRNTYVDLSILLTLVVCSPGISWGRRLRIALLGYLLLLMIHIIGFAAALRIAYVLLDFQQHGIEPGYVTAYGVKAIRDIVYSDLILLIPFVLWGWLYFREWRRSRPGSSSSQNAGKNRRAAGTGKPRRTGKAKRKPGKRSGR